MSMYDEPPAQGTPEWLQARCGRVTASRIKDVLAKTKKGEEAAARRDYKMEIVCEWLTGFPQDDVFENSLMRWGTDHEAEARDVYRAVTGFQVVETGLMLHPTMENSAASPDGLVDNDGLLEIKCPKTATHVKWLLEGIVPPEHVPQMTWQLACNPGRNWVDFMSYDPRLPGAASRFLVRLERDPEAVRAVEAEAGVFLAECLEMKRRVEAFG